jgi:hypothetical protein
MPDNEKRKFFLERERILKHLEKRKKQDIYCQACGYELTYKIAVIINGEAYCVDNWCVEKGLSQHDYLGEMEDPFNPIELQEAIKEGILRKYHLPTNLK